MDVKSPSDHINDKLSPLTQIHH